MSASTSIQKALVLHDSKGSFALSTRDIPTPAAGEILVKIRASALNPVDWKIVDFGVALTSESYPSVLGTDIAGVVEKVGEGVTKFHTGDRVVHQGTINNNDYGGFQQYALVKAIHAAKIPEVLSFEQAATVPVAATCASFGLYQPKPAGAGFTAPWAKDGKGKHTATPILILGGSTSVAQYVIQFAALSGFSPIITTASERHASYLKSLGAHHIIGRAFTAEDLTKITKMPLEFVFDAVSSSETQNAGYAVLASGGQLATVLPTQIKDVDEKKRIFNIWGEFNTPVSSYLPGFLTPKFSGAVSSPEEEQFGKDFYQALEGYLEVASIKPNRVEVVEGGLNGIVGGLDRLRKGMVSGVKLVVRPQDTA